MIQIFKPRRRSPADAIPPEPSLLQEAGNLSTALAAWTRAGFPVASLDQVILRRQACEACPLWDPRARGGLGKCKSPRCGCTKLKWWLATSQCPEKRWPAHREPSA
jgi:hypothetical protein